MADYNVKEILAQDGSKCYVEVANRAPTGTLLSTIESNAQSALSKANGHDVDIEVLNQSLTQSVERLDSSIEENFSRLNKWIGDNTSNITTLKGYFTNGIANKATADKNGADITTTYLKASTKGVANGVASLGADGKVPSSQLPSYVDDVMEYDNKSGFPAKGETDKIYLAKDTNLIYRWSGTTYVEISSSLALGETANTAYAGDKGKQLATNVDALESTVNSLSGQIGTLNTNAAKVNASNTFTQTNTFNGLVNVAGLNVVKSSTANTGIVMLMGGKVPININTEGITINKTIYTWPSGDEMKSGQIAMIPDILANSPVKLGQTFAMNW